MKGGGAAINSEYNSLTAQERSHSTAEVGIFFFFFFSFVSNLQQERKENIRIFFKKK